jgi:hypothetical protein
MSSHHFVKEGQEPALYIHDAVAFGQVESLLEWAPVVITRSSQMEAVVSWGIKVDVVLIETSDPVVDELLLTQTPVRTVTVSGSSNLTTAVRSVLQSDHQRYLTIACADAEVMLNEWRPVSDLETVTIIDTKNRWLGISHQSFSKWLPAGTNLLLFPDDAQYYIEDAGISGNKITTSGEGVITIRNPEFFWVGEFL